MFDLYVDRPEHYQIISHETDNYYHPETSRLFCYAKPGGFVIFVLDRWQPQIDVECSIYGSGRWATREIIRHFVSFVFKDLACQRMTCIVRKSNYKSISMCEKLGMVKEGVLKRATIDGDSVYLYAWFPENCRYLR